MKFTEESTLKEIAEAVELNPYNQYMMYNNPYNVEDQPDIKDDMKLSFTTCIGWSPKGIVDGLNYLADKITRNMTEQYFIYRNDTTETFSDPQMGEVNLIHVKPDNPDPFKEPVFLVSGGGYQAISTIVDGLPCLSHFSKRGHEVFLLTYRVGEMGSAIFALDDVAAAFRFIDTHRDCFGVDISKMIMAGFSAGSNLVATWQLPDVGYRSYQLPAPKYVLLAYGYYDMEDELQRKALPRIMEFMFGDGSELSYQPYNVIEKVDSTFPPAYIVCGAADGLVSPMNSKLLHKTLLQQGVKNILEVAPHTDHGFGDGTGTAAEGWIERALAFFEAI